MYRVQATVSTDVRTIQVPTFSLDETIHGIRSIDHARNIAIKIINPLAIPEYHVFVDIMKE